ncbi:unnamed protein product [uncultured bacterium]|nr:unnamed protein product [uncultured bacterium]
MLTIPPSVKLWYTPRPADFRLGFDGLFSLVWSRLAAGSALFAFRQNFRVASHAV